MNVGGAWVVRSFQLPETTWGLASSLIIELYQRSWRMRDLGSISRPFPI